MPARNRKLCPEWPLLQIIMIDKYIFTVLIATILAAGCSPSADKDETISQTVSKQIDKTQDTAKDVAMDLKAYTFEKKADFMATMNKQQAGLEKQIGEISKQIGNSSDTVKIVAMAKVNALREHSAQLSKQIGEIAGATPTTWDGIKTETQNAYLTVKD